MFPSRRLTAWAGVGLFLAALADPAAPARAADEPAGGTISRRDLDTDLNEALRQVIEEGRWHYNNGRYVECVQVFRGGLIAARHLLSHHPQVQRDIDRGVANARGEQIAWREAIALREVLDGVRNQVPPPTTPIVTRKGDTLWERLGGERNVTRIVNDFVDAAIKDRDVNFFRDGKHKMTPDQIRTMKRHMALLASAVSGGPDQYPGKSMKRVHLGMRITDDEFDAFLKHLKIAMIRHDIGREDVDRIMEAAKSTRKDIVEPRAVAGAKLLPPPATLWARLGEAKGVTRIVDDLVEAAVKDPKVNFDRGGKFRMTPERVAEVKKQMVRLTSALGEGPFKYEGRRMLPAHKGMGITNDEFDAFVSHLKIVLTKHGVGGQDRDLILKAVGATRKDIVEVKGGKAAAPARPAAAPDPAPAPRAAPAADREGAGARGESGPNPVGQFMGAAMSGFLDWIGAGCPFPG